MFRALRLRVPCGHWVWLGLAVVQEVHGPLRVGCRCEDGPFVVFEDLDPASDAGGVVLPHLRGEAEIGTQERAAQLRHKLFHGVALIAEALAPEVTVQAGRVPRPVPGLMSERGVIALAVLEEFEMRHLDVIGTGRVVGPVSAMADFPSGMREESIEGSDALFLAQGGRGGGGVVVSGRLSICSTLNTV
jgi:hypothetical protein